MLEWRRRLLNDVLPLYKYMIIRLSIYIGSVDANVYNCIALFAGFTWSFIELGVFGIFHFNSLLMCILPL